MCVPLFRKDAIVSSLRTPPDGSWKRFRILLKPKWNYLVLFLFAYCVLQNFYLISKASRSVWITVIFYTLWHLILLIYIVYYYFMNGHHIEYLHLRYYQYSLFDFCYKSILVSDFLYIYKGQSQFIKIAFSVYIYKPMFM